MIHHVIYDTSTFNLIFLQTAPHALCRSAALLTPCRGLWVKETAVVSQTNRLARRLATAAVNCRRHGNTSGSWQMQGTELVYNMCTYLQVYVHMYIPGGWCHRIRLAYSKLILCCRQADSCKPVSLM